MKLFETGSSLATFATCPRKYEYKYEKLIEPKGYPAALIVGRIIHAIAEDNHRKQQLQCWTKEIKSLKEQYGELYVDRLANDIKYATEVGNMWAAYWNGLGGDLGNQSIEWLEVEREWKFSIDDDTIAGKSDGYLLQKPLNKKFLYELKTATDRDRESYLSMLQVNAQINNNAIALAEEDKPVDGIIYDIIWKPALRQKVKETEDELVDRIVETIKADPAQYFTRVMIFRTNRTLVEHLPDLKGQLGAIREAKERNYYYRNTGSCRQFFQTCPYFDACVENNGAIDNSFDKKSIRHTELSKELQDGTKN